ncbi:hypothetical protein BV157_01259 [Haemophilus influenzae]|nr:hypothetical protein BV157_01259 [Haemophilus influenzae]
MPRTAAESNRPRLLPQTRLLKHKRQHKRTVHKLPSLKISSLHRLARKQIKPKKQNASKLKQKLAVNKLRRKEKELHVKKPKRQNASKKPLHVSRKKQNVKPQNCWQNKKPQLKPKHWPHADKQKPNAKLESWLNVKKQKQSVKRQS